MKKKILMAVFSIVMCLCMCLGIVGCSNNNGTDSGDNQNPKIVAIYNTYVAYAKENGITPLSYEEWIESIKGDKGDKGDTGATGAAGVDGITPQLKVGEDNYWYVSYDNGTTWASLNVKATGDKGETGATGADGITPQLKVGEDNYWYVSYDNGTTWVSLNVKATGDKGDTGVGVKNIYINGEGKLIIVLSNDEEIDCGIIKSNSNVEEYTYINDKELLEFVLSTKKYISNANVVHDKLLKSNNYKNAVGFSYGDALLFVKDNFTTIKNLFKACNDVRNSYAKISPYANYISFASDMFIDFSASVDSFYNVRCNVLVYINSIRETIDNLTKSFNVMEAIVIANSSTDLNNYENETSYKVTAFTLKEFIQKAKALSLIFSEICERIVDTTNLQSVLEGYGGLINLANTYTEEIYGMKEELLKEYNNGVINEKINSIYNLIDNIYDKTIDYKNTNNILLIDTYLNEMRFNLEVLNVLIEIA